MTLCKNVLLNIKNLHVSLDNTKIIKGVNLTVKKGEVHAIMGPNGSGKSTLSKAIAGHPSYNITSGEINFNHEMINDIEAHQRAQKGIFLGFQYPVEIPGVSNIDFLRASYNSLQDSKGKHKLSPLEFFDLVSNKLESIEMSPSFLTRSVNEGFSGGEKKKNEILQMTLLEPLLSILDETDVM